MLNMELTKTPNIEVEYKSLESERGLKIVLALSPFWAAWAPGMLWWMCLNPWTTNSTDLDPVWVSTALELIATTLVSVATLWVCRQNKILINEEGILFPAWCLLQLGGKLKKTWAEIAEMQFCDSRQKLSRTPDLINIKFNSGSMLTLRLDSFKQADLEKFTLALESFVPSLPMQPALAEVDLRIEHKNKATEIPSFTQIWENDMSSRFGSTVFVPLEPGERLKNGKLEIVGQIAFGGLSAIYLAKSNQNQLRVVKEAVLPSSADLESKEKALQLFEREAELLMKLRHPRIAVVEDYFTENGRHYLLLEHIDGKDLRRFVKEKGIPSEATVIRWLREMSEILQYLHEQDPPIIHRDLTPDNLILTGDGSINLIDFGAANTFLGTATGTIIGKQSYISPEQFRGKATPQSDLYSLGATIYFLLTGEDPEALSQSDPRLINSEISREMGALVTQLTELEADKRIASAKELLTQMQNLGEPRSRDLKMVEERMVP